MLPSKLKYDNQITASMGKNYNTVLQPQNTSNFGLGETCIITIPCNANTVLSGQDCLLNVQLDMASSSADNLVKLDRAGVAGIIGRLRLFSGSQLLCDIDNYGNLINMLTAYQVGSDDTAGFGAVLQGLGDSHGADFGNIATAGGTPVLKNYSFPLMSIMNLTNNYIPCWALAGSGGLRLELQFVSDVAQFAKVTAKANIAPTTGSTMFKKVSLTANYIELSDSAMGIIQSSLGGKPVEWVCQSYSNYVYNTSLVANASTSVSVPIPAKFNSAKALYATFRENSAGANLKFPNASNKYGLDEYSFRIGSKVMPSTKPTTASEFLGEVVRALGSVGNRINPHSIKAAEYDVNDDSETVSNAFAVGMELESYSSMDGVYQGTNTSLSDTFFEAKFSVGATGKNIRIDTYASYDQLVVIDNGAVSVQF